MSNNRVIWGVILITVGFLFLLSQLNLLDLDFKDVFSFIWPVALIAVGIYIMVKHYRSKSEIENDFGDVCMSFQEGIRKYSNIAGDQNYEAKGVNVKGKVISGVFGDISLNLAESVLSDGVNKITLSGVFGDITVIVPNNMEAYAKGSNTFGDIHIFGQRTDGIGKKLINQTEGYEMATSKVKIMVDTTFGDVKIYRA